MLPFCCKSGRMLRINPRVSCQVETGHPSDTTRTPKLVSLDRGKDGRHQQLWGLPGLLDPRMPSRPPPLPPATPSLAGESPPNTPTIHPYPTAGICPRVLAEPPLSLGEFGTASPLCPFPSCIFLLFPPLFQAHEASSAAGR